MLSVKGATKQFLSHLKSSQRNKCCAKVYGKNGLIDVTACVRSLVVGKARGGLEKAWETISNFSVSLLKCSHFFSRTASHNVRIESESVS